MYFKLLWEEFVKTFSKKADCCHEGRGEAEIRRELGRRRKEKERVRDF